MRACTGSTWTNPFGKATVRAGAHVFGVIGELDDRNTALVPEEQAVAEDPAHACAVGAEPIGHAWGEETGAGA